MRNPQGHSCEKKPVLSIPFDVAEYFLEMPPVNFTLWLRQHTEENENPPKREEKDHRSKHPQKGNQT